MAKVSTVVFVFTGEFGYELLNWSGKIAKFASENSDLKILVCSSEASKALYSDQIEFIGLNVLDSFHDALADTYFLRIPNFVRDSICDVFTAHARRRKIRKFVANRTNLYQQRVLFIFSDQKNILRGTTFGATRWAPRFNLFRKRYFEEIYDNLPYLENSYSKLETRPEILSLMQKRLDNLGVRHKFMLIQTADRVHFLKKRRFTAKSNEIMSEIISKFPVVELDFNQLRNTDSRSTPSASTRITCNSLEEQIALINLASVCVFFSEGDFRSLHYVPPMAGKNVYSLVSSSIISNSAINLWNEKVFNFGGKCIPICIEALLWDLKIKEKVFELWSQILK